MRPSDTICFKHDEIARFAQKVIDMVDEAKDCGIRMEEGLTEKRRRIEALESEVEDLRAELERAEKMIGSLQEENQELAAELRAAQAEI